MDEEKEVKECSCSESGLCDCSGGDEKCQGKEGCSCEKEKKNMCCQEGHGCCEA